MVCSNYVGVREVMTQFFNRSYLVGLFFLCSSVAVSARDLGTAEYTFYIPVVESTSIDFQGGANLETEQDFGFGMGFGGAITDSIVGSVTFSFNNIHYSAERIIDDSDRSRERISSRLDTFSIAVGGDYYFTDEKLSPFVNLNMGYTFINTNIASGPPQGVCWWDPWWGYICDSYVPTYSENSFNYGGGVGLRLDVSRYTFFKLGYYEQVLDINKAKGSPKLSMFKLEVGRKMNFF